MKKMIAFLLMMVVAVQFGIARDVITMNPKELPAAAQTFLKQHFENRQISYIKVESEFLSKKYEVVMTDRTKIEFDGDGEWEEVECKYTTVPAAIVPQGIRDFVAQKSMPGIRKIERNTYVWEVELQNGIELTFDKNFQLIGYDD